MKTEAEIVEKLKKISELNLDKLQISAIADDLYKYFLKEVYVQDKEMIHVVSKTVRETLNTTPVIYSGALGELIQNDLVSIIASYNTTIEGQHGWIRVLMIDVTEGKAKLNEV